MKKHLCIYLALLALTASKVFAQSIYTPYTFTNFAGFPGGVGTADGAGSEARFGHPAGVAVDAVGNVYVADSGNNTIRKITPAGEVTTLAGSAEESGSGDGTGRDARFNRPFGVAVDSAGNIYVADNNNYTIRKITPVGEVTTLAGTAGQHGTADGVGNTAQFNNVKGVAVDSAGNVYVADGGLCDCCVCLGRGTIRKITPAGEVTTLARSVDDMGSGAPSYYYSGVAVDSAGNVYVADVFNDTIRKVTSAGVVTTVAGSAEEPGSADGTGSDARFNGPFGVAVDSAGNVFVAETYNNTIRKVTPAGVVTTLAGLAQFDSNGNGVGGSADGTGRNARFNGPSGVAVDSAGNVYVADTFNNTIRKGYPATMILSSGPGFGFNGGQFGFNLTGPTGQSVVVEASTDLVRWLPLWTNTFAPGLKFRDPQSGVYSDRFYRATLPSL